MIVSDGAATYAIFNYKEINWIYGLAQGRGTEPIGAQVRKSSIHIAATNALHIPKFITPHMII